MHSSDPAIRKAAMDEWHVLFDAQSDPTTKFFDGAAGEPATKNVADRCPAWAHVRKANPRQTDGTPQKLIFRRGYPFMETGIDHKTRSGLLFISFRKDLDTFEFIKKNWFGNGSFPVPAVRAQFNDAELAARHRGGRFNAVELNAMSAAERTLIGLGDPADFNSALADASDTRTQQTGREGLAGPSEQGITPTGEFLAIVPLGGGYYFVPPIPNKDVSQIGQPYFA
jgi:hypothetical protein